MVPRTSYERVARMLKSEVHHPTTECKDVAKLRSSVSLIEFIPQVPSLAIPEDKNSKTEDVILSYTFVH